METILAIMITKASFSKEQEHTHEVFIHNSNLQSLCVSCVMTPNPASVLMIQTNSFTYVCISLISIAGKVLLSHLM